MFGVSVLVSARVLGWCVVVLFGSLGFSEDLGLVCCGIGRVFGFQQVVTSEFCVCRCVRFPAECSPSRRADSLPHTSDCGEVFSTDTDH